MKAFFKVTSLILTTFVLAACSLSGCGNDGSIDGSSSSGSVSAEPVSPQIATLKLKSSLDKIRDAESYELFTDFSSDLSLETNVNDVVSLSEFISEGDILVSSIKQDSFTNQVIELDGEGVYTDELQEETDVGFGFDLYQYQGESYLNIIPSAELFALFDIPLLQSRIRFQMDDLIDEIIQLLEDMGILDPNDPLLEPISIDIFDLLPSPVATSLGSFITIRYTMTKEALVHLVYGWILAQQGIDISTLPLDEVNTTETAILTELTEVKIKAFTLEFRISVLDQFVHFKISADVTNTIYEERYEENSERIMTRYRQHVIWNSTTVLLSLDEPLDIRFPSNLSEYTPIDIAFLLDLFNR